MIDELMIDEIQATSHHYPATQKYACFQLSKSFCIKPLDEPTNEEEKHQEKPVTALPNASQWLPPPASKVF